jgi:hypothetical protein
MGSGTASGTGPDQIHQKMRAQTRAPKGLIRCSEDICPVFAI